MRNIDNLFNNVVLSDLSETSIEEMESKQSSCDESLDKSFSGNRQKAVVKVGDSFQAVCPELEPVASRRPELLEEKAVLVWSPTDTIPDRMLDAYVNMAKDIYDCGEKQALVFLRSHNYDIRKASRYLANFRPVPNEWSEEDKMVFSEGVKLHGRNMNAIHKMLPNKSFENLLKFYYLYKKNKFLDIYNLVLDSKSDDDSSSSEDSDSCKQTKKKMCGKCGQKCKAIHLMSNWNYCHVCSRRWKRTGNLRAKSYLRRWPNKPRLPRGIYLKHNDILKLMLDNKGNESLAALEREYNSLRDEVEKNKKEITELNKRLFDSQDEIGKCFTFTSDINTGWANEEIIESDCKQRGNYSIELEIESDVKSETEFEDLEVDSKSEIWSADETTESEMMDIGSDINEVQRDSNTSVSSSTSLPSDFF